MPGSGSLMSTSALLHWPAAAQWGLGGRKDAPCSLAKGHGPLMHTEATTAIGQPHIFLLNHTHCRPGRPQDHPPHEVGTLACRPATSLWDQCSVHPGQAGWVQRTGGDLEGWLLRDRSSVPSLEKSKRDVALLRKPLKQLLPKLFAKSISF